MTMYYRFRGISGEPVNANKLERFETLEAAMSDEKPNGSHFWSRAIVIQSDVPLVAGVRVDMDDIVAKWFTDTGWLTPDDPRWDKHIL